MKIKTFAAIAIAVSLAIFAGRKIATTTFAKPASFNIEGEWKLDSAYEPDPGIATAIMQSAIKKNTRIVFMKDSIASAVSEDDTSSVKYYLNDSTLFLNTGDGFKPNKILQAGNDTFRYRGGDSLIMVLIRRDKAGSL